MIPVAASDSRVAISQDRCMTGFVLAHDDLSACELLGISSSFTSVRATRDLSPLALRLRESVDYSNKSLVQV